MFFQPLCRGTLVCRDILSGVPVEIIQFGFFPTKDMQTTPLRSGHLYMKDAHSAELNEKSYFYLFSYGGFCTDNESKFDQF